LWATCDQDLQFSLTFVSTCFDAWLRCGLRNEERTLYGAIGCFVNDSLRFFKVLRVGRRISDEARREAEILKTIPFENVFYQADGEIELSPDHERQDLTQAIAKITKCDPSRIRL
jgi:hypothetical protein